MSVVYSNPPTAAPGTLIFDGFVGVNYTVSDPPVEIATVTGTTLLNLTPTFGLTPTGMNFVYQQVTPTIGQLFFVGTPTTAQTNTSGGILATLGNASNPFAQFFQSRIRVKIVVTPPNNSTLPTAVVAIFYTTQIIITNQIAGDAIQLITDTGLPPGLSAGYAITPTGATITISGTASTTVGSPFTVNFTVSSVLTGTSILTYSLPVSLVCIATGTNILMADGLTRRIENVKRGDWVAGDADGEKIYRVAKVTSTRHRPEHLLEIYRFSKDAISPNVPSQPLLITPSHAIHYNGARYQAKYFSEKPGVHLVNDRFCKLVLMHNREYRLWDMQFETIGSYVANGVKIQSRHPFSINTPLEPHLFFDRSLYKTQLQDDNDEAYDTKLITQPVD